MHTESIAILYICTGKYSIFWKDFYQSSERFFLPNQQKRYFVFSDTLQLDGDSDKIKIIRQEKLGWPYDTLMRFHLFDSIKDELKNFDFIFFCNANLIFNNTISKDILYCNNKPADLIVVNHPFFHWVKVPYNFPYERNKKSLAYIPRKSGSIYAFGAFNGGTSASYLCLIKTLKDRIDMDLSKKIIALWHDESHLNKYILESEENINILSHNYGYPEGHDLPLKDNIYKNS